MQSLAVTDSFVEHRLLSNGQLLVEFPPFNDFRNRLIPLREKCASCHGKQAAIAELGKLFNDVRTFMSALDETSVARIKTLMNVDKPLFVAYRVTENNRKILRSKQL